VCVCVCVCVTVIQPGMWAYEFNLLLIKITVDAWRNLP